MAGRLFRKRWTLADSKRSIEFHAAAADKAGITDHGGELEITLKQKRIRRPVDGEPVIPLEKTIVADILKALRRDPRVGFVWRQTSGTFQEGERWIQTGPKGMPDICAVLYRSGRFFACEVKRPGKEPDERQAGRIEHFKRCGAVAGVAHSVAEAMAMLEP